MTDLTVLCVTSGAAYAAPFLDDMAELAGHLGAPFAVVDGRGAGCIESVLDDAVAACDDGYILRLDDDERVSHWMRLWLFAREYRADDHWAFPRLNLWPDASSYIVSPPLFPDLQTRLSVKAKSGGRTAVHAGSPFGTGRVAEVAIEHHKFLVRTADERRALVAHYEELSPGAGNAFVPFSLPEAMTDVEVELYEQAVPV